MAYHVVAYSANTNTQTNFDSAPIVDSQIPIQNAHFLPQMDLMLFGGAFLGANLTAVTLVTPRSRMVVPPRLFPIIQSITVPDRPHIFDRRHNPFKLNAVEEVSLQMNIGGTANAQNVGVMFWGDRLDPVPPGDIYGLHGTSTTAAVSLQWTQLTVTWDQTLPAGTYAVVGSQVQSTNAIAHRIHFLDQVFRPGFLSLASVGNISDPSYYYGGWGKLGQFVTYAYPYLEVLVNGTDAAHDCVLNLVKVS